MRSITLLVLISVLVTYGLEVAWEKTYGLGDRSEARGVIQDYDGDYLVTGLSVTGQRGSALLFKTDTAGNVMWEKTYNRGDWDVIYEIIPTSDSCYMLAGFTSKGCEDSDQRDVYLIKVDTSGDTLWQRNYGLQGSEEAAGIIETTDNYLVVTGYTDSYEGKDTDILVLKLNSDGDTVWMRNYGGKGSESGNAVIESENGYVIIGTRRKTDTADLDIYLMEISKDGNVLWDDDYGGGGDDWVNDVVLTTVNGYVVLGGTTSHRAEGGHLYALGLDKYGGRLWEQLFGGTAEDEGYAGVKIGYTGYLLAGRTASFGEGADDVYLIEIDKGGNYQWEKTLGGEGDDVANSVTSIPEGFLVAGKSSSFGEGETRCYLVKLSK
ncbi:hypothetical protein GF359_00155 [candidate division WOR-3 bacterium]|uniref:Bulb-type lectin domain-containing protein n=1 Tax=candidate division WOR-3 bacterium TaxID=2052148 RepID=A0A9D5K8Z9_UNCW3|nr:hypothetical protein [candidate division WOR-3 bacterium]MBD3363606.1 hypothetical protein [candidate division WOR-3 bacterium]